MRRLLTALAALAAGVLLAAPAVAEWPVAGVPAEPIPQDPSASSVVPYLGHGRALMPVDPGETAPQHPVMAPNGVSNLHDDAYQSDNYLTSGPLGYSPQVSSTWLDHECASITFDSRGRIVTVCVGIERPVLVLMDPKTLTILATYDLPPRQASTLNNVFTSFGGGGYFYLDNMDRAVVPTTAGTIDVIGEHGNGFGLDDSFDVSSAAGNASIISALPDWSGRIWFVTATGVVGFVDPTTAAVQSIQTHESIGNSFAVDETGGVFVVTDHALYRFDAVDGKPKVTWRQPYDRGTRQKPGQTEFGSGVTPTIVKHAGNNYVAITDNADPQMHVLVYRAGASGPGSAPVCEIPVFVPGQSATDNSIIAWGDSLVVENNYGYTGVYSASEQRTPTTQPGVTRIDVDYDNGGCHVVWDNEKVRVPTSVSKSDTANGVIYVYEHPAPEEIHYRSSPGPGGSQDAWYLTALDIDTGRRVWSQLTGTGIGYNNNWAAITVGPNHTIYLGTLGGMVAVRDGSAPPAASTAAPDNNPAQVHATRSAPATSLPTTGGGVPARAAGFVVAAALIYSRFVKKRASGAHAYTPYGSPG